MTTAINGVFVSKVHAPTSPSPSMTGTVLALIAHGAKRLALRDSVYEYRAGQYLVASVDLPVTGLWTVSASKVPYKVNGAIVGLTPSGNFYLTNGATLGPTPLPTAGYIGTPDGF